MFLIEKKLYLNIIGLIYGPLCMWSASIELNSEMKNQKCCYSCTDTEDYHTNPYDTLTYYNYYYASIFLLLAIIPWFKFDDDSLIFISFFVSFATIIFSSFVLADLNMDKCINPSTKPIKLIIDNYFYKFFIVILHFIIMGIFICGNILYLIISSWLEIIKIKY